MNVLVTRPIPDAGITLLRDAGCRIEVAGDDAPLNAEELRFHAKDKDAIIAFPCDQIDSVALDAALPRLKIVSNYGVGVNHIDLAAAKERGVYVGNTPGVLTEATAEMALALLMASARRVVAADRFVRDGSWIGPDALTLNGLQISGKTLGVIGAGRIGSSFIAKCSGLGLQFLYSHPRRNFELEEKTGAAYAERDDLLRSSDFISLHVPLSPATRHMIGEREFSLMKPTALLINAARGPVIDERALVAALLRGQIWGAGLDVFENEPHPLPELIGLSNVILTPHVGSGTVETRCRMAVLAAKNILAVRDGRPPLHQVV